MLSRPKSGNMLESCILRTFLSLSPTQTLMWFAPFLMLSRVARIHSSTPSTTLPRAEGPMPPQHELCGTGPLPSLHISVLSPCPPVWDSIRPPWNTLGPGIRNSSVALACAIVAPPVSRTVVKPLDKMPRNVPAERIMACSWGNVKAPCRVCIHQLLFSAN